MCGRFSLTADAETISKRFHVKVPNWTPRYNLAPSQDALTIISGNELKLMKWGLIPHWAKEKGQGIINARSESIHDKPSFKNCKRCLVLADGFYEWKNKRSFRFTLKDKALFAFAGLCSEGQFTIVTVHANKLTSQLHDRMPAILTPDAEKLWIDPEFSNYESILMPYPEEQMTFYEVSPVVNSYKNDTIECIKPLLEIL